MFWELYENELTENRSDAYTIEIDDGENAAFAACFISNGKISKCIISRTDAR